jgi:hypothetical protein
MSNDFYFPRSYDLPFPDPKALNVKEQCVQIQYDLPKRLNHYAQDYPNLTWFRAQVLYERAVEEVIRESGEKDLLSGELSFGRGWKKAEEKFIEFIQAEGYSKALHF